ncbi:MAG: Smr/MutS family protein [Pseudomonadota bacterium]
MTNLDRKTRRKIARGGASIDGRIDLHGMTQAEAHAALRRFVENSFFARYRMVLVITGKGSGGDGRGILRRQVPHWLAQRDLADLIAEVGPAHPSHGGDGALYVRLRTLSKMRRR